MDPCEEKEPKVIDDGLITKLIYEQGPKGEAGRLAREDGIPFEEVQVIRFEYLHILRIDHLWVLPNLRKLVINNNHIEKIENLQTLIHLEELDLSFNKITKIENLGTLVKIEKLSFFQNEIKVIINLENLKKLTIFSIGRNLIEDLSNVIYLRQFKNLKSVNMAGNPVANEPNFEFFIAAFLPRITYYEYKRIYDLQRQEALEMFAKDLADLNESEAAAIARLQQKEKEVADAEIHALSFVEYLGGRELFESFFEDDEDGRALLEMEEAEEYYAEFEEEVVKYCRLVFEMGQEQYKIRKAEIDQFEEGVERATKEVQDQSIKNMDEFLIKKNAIFEEIKHSQEQLEFQEITRETYNEKIEELEKEYEDFLHKTWKQLMKLELDVHEQMEEVNEGYGRNITDMMNNFIEQAQALFAVIRSAEDTYQELIAEAAGRLQTNMNLNEELEIAEALKPIMVDKESLLNAIGASHEIHLFLIDQREDQLVNGAKEWLEALANRLDRGEIIRNRNKVLEINHFLDVQREEFDLVCANVFTPPVDTDMSATLE